MPRATGLAIKAQGERAGVGKRIVGGIANQSVSGWERGYVSRPEETIFEFIRIFGVPLVQFWRKPTSSALRNSTAPSPVSLVFVAIEARP
jgi:hypothetical protein